MSDLRTVLARLEPNDGRQTRDWLATWQVDLLDDDLGRALVRVRSARDDPEQLNPAAEVSGLIWVLARRGRLDDAMRAVALLPSNQCDRDNDFSELPRLARGAGDQRRAAAFVDRLLAAPELRQVCPAGLPPEHLAQLEFDVERYDRVLAAADRIVDQAEATGLKLRVVSAWREAG